MSGLFGGKSNAATDPALGSMKVQTSTYGTVIPVVYGRAKISGNLGWFNNFKSAPVTQEQSGKGGGSAVITGYTYSADTIMFLGEGPITNVRTVWHGKTKIEATNAAFVDVNVVEELVIQPGGVVSLLAEVQHTVLGVDVQILRFSEYSDQPLSFNSSGAVLTSGLLPGARQIVGFPAIYVGYTARISYTRRTTFQPLSALSVAGLSLRTGAVGQAPVAQIVSSYPNEALAYAGIAYVYGQDYPLGNQGAVENHQFEVDGALLGTCVPGLPDADPAMVVLDILTNPRNGVELERGLIDEASLAKFSDYCIALGLGISPAYTSQRAARESVGKILEATNTLAAWVGDRLKFIPRGDKAVTANGRTYIPDNAVAFDIGPDDFEPGRDGPVQVSRKGLTARANNVSAEWSNRANNYNTETVAWSDDAARDRDGVNSEPALSWGFFCDSTAANTALTLRGQAAQAQLATYNFSLGWRYIAIEPGDLLRLSDPLSGINRVIVRVTAAQEDSNDSVRITAVDFPIGNASAPAVPSQLGSGFSPLQNSPPGNCTPPAFIEPPGGLTSTGLEVWVSTSGVGPLWGGCEIYTSLDNASFKHAGTIELGARYGTITSSLAGGGGSVPVSLVGKGGQLIGITAAAADSQQSLCFIGTPASGEYVSFVTATLTGANAYNLGGLRRGQNGTANNAHATGESFVFVDSALGRSGPLDRSLVGKTIYFKLVSFNVFGGGRQSLGSVPAYPYTITGRFMDQLGQPITAANIGVGVAGNLLSNSDWRTNGEGWPGYFAGSGPDVRLAKVEDSAANMLPSPPRNYVLSQVGANGSQYSYTQSPPFSVAEGQRYGFASDVISQGAPTVFILRWLDINGSMISDATWVVTPESSSGAPSNLGSYTRAGGFGIAPAGAKQAVLILLKNATSSGGSSYAWFSRPTVAIAGPSQTDLPQWDAGAAIGALASFHMADTAQLVPAAATLVAETTGGSVSRVTADTTPGDALTAVLSITVNNPTLQTVPVIISGIGKITATNTSVFLQYAGSYITSSGEGLNPPATETSEGGSIPPTQTRAQSVTPKRRFSLAPGATETYTMYMAQSQSLSATFETPKLLAEIIKR